MAKQDGFSLLEWALATALVGLFIFLFLDRILDLQADVERVRVLQLEGRMKSKLGLEFSRRVVAHDLASLENLHGSNPMDLLDEQPDHYLGAKRQPELDSLPAMAWVFDQARGVLIYTVSHRERFHSHLPGRPRMEYRIDLDYLDLNENGRFDYSQDQLRAPKLVSLGEGSWK
jgi:general secretion pathway protein G